MAAAPAQYAVCFETVAFSVALPPQLVPSRWETAEASRATARAADPCRTSLELTQMRKLHCNRGPRGNLGRTLSASLLFCSIWRARPPALEGLTPPCCHFLFQVCLFTFLSQSQRPSRGHSDTSDMSPRSMDQAPGVFVWTCVSVSWHNQ